MIKVQGNFSHYQRPIKSCLYTSSGTPAVSAAPVLTADQLSQVLGTVKDEMQLLRSNLSSMPL